MKLIVLSNHLKAQLKEVRRERSAADAEREATYQAELAKYQAHQQLRGARRLNWLLRFWDWLLCRSLPALVCPEPPEKAAPVDREAVLEAGAAGQRLVLEALGKQLDDEWCAIAGYHNAAGELDLLLVGPLGVLALECKHMVGTIHCDAGRWTRDKPVRGGVVERGLPIADRTGRSPSQQVNQIASGFEKALRRHACEAPIARAVVFSHERSRLGRLQAANVDVVTLRDLDVKALLSRANPTPPSPTPVAAIVQAARRHHESHQRWLQQRSSKRRSHGGRAA